MKKQYERRNCIIVVSIIIFMMEVLFILFLFNSRVVLYEKFSGIVSNKGELEFLLSDEELKLFYKNKVLFVDNKRKKFIISKVERAILERKGIFYNQVFIRIDISNMYKVNDVVDISIQKRSVKSINIFKVIWEAD